MPLESLNDRINIRHLTLDQPRHQNPNPVAELFEELSKRVWLRLEHSLVFDVSQGEETITDINLLDMKIAGLNEIKLWKCPKSREPELGIDWWWLIGNDQVGWRSYMVQAKKLDLHTGLYRNLNHRVGDRTQIDILEEEASERCAMPLFCFYNYVNPPALALEDYVHCRAQPREMPQLGCTITPLWLVKNIVNKRSRPTERTFDYIHKRTDTIPWRCLVRCQHAAAAYSDPKNAPPECDTAVVYKTYSDIPEEVRQRFGTPGSEIDTVSTIASGSPISFAPKRIAIIQTERIEEEPPFLSQQRHPLPEVRRF